MLIFFKVVFYLRCSNIAIFSPEMQSLMGIAPQAIVPNLARPRAAGSLPNTTAPHSSVQTGLQANTFRLDMNVVPRSTMNTNGETEN